MNEILNTILLCLFVIFFFVIVVDWLLLPLSITKSMEQIEKAIKELKRK